MPHISIPKKTDEYHLPWSHVMAESSVPLTDREFRLFVEAARWLETLQEEAYCVYERKDLSGVIEDIAKTVGIMLTEADRQRIAYGVLNHA